LPPRKEDHFLLENFFLLGGKQTTTKDLLRIPCAAFLVIFYRISLT
jgi:hypothetical protein